MAPIDLAGRVMGLEQLRRDWQQQIEDFDSMIAAGQGDAAAEKVDDQSTDARHVWVGKLQAWRAELQKLLEEYP